MLFQGSRYQAIEFCGYNGGLTFAPSNFFTQDIPVESMIAFSDFVKEYKL